MRRALSLIAPLALCLGAALPQAQAADVVFISKDKVAASMTAPGTLNRGDDHRVIMSRREQAGQSEIHAKETDVFYVLEGSATFVTGGSVTDGKTTAPGETRGSGITGGQTHMLTVGDVIVIPKGTPHWFKEVPDHVVYYVVKAVTN
jgi:quercetin dioxygenase-like cupin family protein